MTTDTPEPHNPIHLPSWHPDYNAPKPPPTVVPFRGDLRPATPEKAVDYVADQVAAMLDIISDDPTVWVTFLDDTISRLLDMQEYIAQEHNLVFNDEIEECTHGEDEICFRCDPEEMLSRPDPSSDSPLRGSSEGAETPEE